MGRLLGVAILVIDVLIILEIFKSRKDNEKKILWIVVVVFIPIVGPLLYLMIGRK